MHTGAGEDHGIDHDKNWLRFPYDSTFLRSHYLHPHPYRAGGTSGALMVNNSVPPSRRASLNGECPHAHVDTVDDGRAACAADRVRTQCDCVARPLAGLNATLGGPVSALLSRCLNLERVLCMGVTDRCCCWCQMRILGPLTCSPLFAWSLVNGLGFPFDHCFVFLLVAAFEAGVLFVLMCGVTCDIDQPAQEIHQPSLGKEEEVPLVE
jgi:hypothetical protein